MPEDKESGAGVQPPVTMYLDQSAHLDWDWVQTFEENFNSYPPAGATARGGVDKILTKAIDLLGADPDYHYTICEMGFLRRYIEQYPPTPTSPGAAALLKGFGNRFQALSGGITSPDCQVCSAEGFIRNYLVGRRWLKQALDMDAKPHCWLPDDFGQGPELPALLQALGFVSMSFSRLPGTQPYWSGPAPLKDQLLAQGLDFVWTSSDGSRVYAHWQTWWYSLGNKLEQYGRRHPEAINFFLEQYGTRSATGYSGANKPFMYVPIDDDFSMPLGGIADDVSDWNTNKPIVAPGGLAATGVTVVQGTFDQFMTAVVAADQADPTLATGPYNGTPYWTGYYASRPGLKILHYQCVRALTAAEIFGLLAEQSGAVLPAAFWDDVDTAWDNFAPSTHHDYVCGTATDDVYTGEQLTRLRQATTSPANPTGAIPLRAAALSAIAASAGPAGGVLIGNSLGFDSSGLAETGPAPAGAGSFVLGGRSFPIQATAEGGTVTFANLSGLSYAGGAWSEQPPTAALPGVTAVENGDGTFTLANGLVTATIDPAGNLLKLLDGPETSGTNILAPPGSGGDLGFYYDAGGLYRFGNEQKQMYRDSDVVIQSQGCAIVEGGPLRVRLRATIAATVKGRSFTYTREYALATSESILRVTVGGTAPPSYSVMAIFALAGAPVALDHGTPGHWTSVQPGTLLDGSPYWPGPVFRATHDFVLPRDASGRYLGAVYHGGIPAWAIDGQSVIGCLLRDSNNNDDGLGASGTDTGEHVQSYALRVPSGLGDPKSGQPLREALSFSTPLQTAPIPASAPAAPAGASIGGTDSAAVITVAKPGAYDPTSLILRLQQPTNAPLTVTINMATQPTAANLLDAAEGPWTGGGSAVPGASGTLIVQMTGALATVELPGLGRRPAAASRNAASASPPPPTMAGRPGILARLLAMLRRWLGRD